MIFDTNLVIGHIRRLERLPAQAIIPMVVVGELEAFALKADWGYQKVTFLQSLLDYYPLVEVSRSLTGLYAQVDAFSQGKLWSNLLSPGITARNMVKNDLWIAATSLYFDMDLHTTDNDFDRTGGPAPTPIWPSVSKALMRFPHRQSTSVTIQKSLYGNYPCNIRSITVFRYAISSLR